MRLLAISLLLVQCAARTGLAAPVPDASADVTTPDAQEERQCPFDCFIGHECCVGGCGGPPASMPNDCCVCLPGEKNSFDCNKSSKCQP